MPLSRPAGEYVPEAGLFRAVFQVQGAMTRSPRASKYSLFACYPIETNYALLRTLGSRCADGGDH
jgi:hypothetical protein